MSQSTSAKRIASERDGTGSGWLSRHVSIAVLMFSGRRKATKGIWPVAGLPIGFQMIGRPWDEASLMYAASVIEAAVKEDLRLPAIFYDVLSSK